MGLISYCQTPCAISLLMIVHNFLAGVPLLQGVWESFCRRRAHTALAQWLHAVQCLLPTQVGVFSVP